METRLTLEMTLVTESAAIAAAKLTGKGKKDDADQAAVNAMRKAFDTLDMRGRIVIGEGERDEAPMLFIGEEVGNGDAQSPQVDIAVDPLEGTNLCAYARPSALSVMAVAQRGNLLHAPDIYMNKIVVGPAAKGVISLDKTPTENLKAVASAKGVYVEDLTVVVLDRERHADLINEIRASGARIQLIPDGDVSPAILACHESSGVDVLMGIGGAPEGVISAAALKCVGGDMQGRLVPKDNAQRERCISMGVENPDAIMTMDQIAKGDVMFVATGVTTGEMLKGVRFETGLCKTHSMVMCSKTGTIRFIETEHRL